MGDSTPLEEIAGGLVYRVSPAAFFQVNRAAADRLHAMAVDAALQGLVTPLVIDAYCGVGALALRLAAAGAKAIGVDVVPPAIEDARMAARMNGLASRVELVNADVALALFELQRRGARPDSVILNPPRKGCAPQVLEAVAGLAPSRIVYVSCNPDTLARDLGHLVSGSRYRICSVTPVDLFPESEHVEVLAVLEGSTTGISRTGASTRSGAA